MQELYESLEGERRRISAYRSVQYVLIMRSREGAYHMLKGKTDLAPVLWTSLPDSNEGAMG